MATRKPSAGKRRMDDHATEVAGRLIEQIKAGTAPWQKPWEPGHSNEAPYNPTTGKPYRGGNHLWLRMQGRSDPRWMTFRQAQAAGAHVKAGEHGVQLEYWVKEERHVLKDKDGKPVLDKDGKTQTVTAEADRPKCVGFKVFNAEQIEGLPALPLKTPPHEWERQQRAENILRASGANITHTVGDNAYYRPSTDTITLPAREQFKSADGYYSTALHELSHWTGHASRLDRPGGASFGSEAYAREELRAEIGSMMIGDRVGIGHSHAAHDEHASYVQSWVKVLREDPREIFRAARDGERIADYVAQFDHELQHEATHETVAHKEPEPTPEESAHWHKDEWRIEPSLHASADPVMGTPGGQLWQEERAEPEAVAEMSAVQHEPEQDAEMDDDEGMEM